MTTETEVKDLRQLRKESGYGFLRAASKIGITPSFLSYIETGKRGMSIKVAMRMANLYGVSLEEIVRLHGQKQNQ